MKRVARSAWLTLLVLCTACAPKKGEQFILKNPRLPEFCKRTDFVPLRSFEKQDGKTLVFNSGMRSEQVNCFDSTPDHQPPFEYKVVFSVRLTNVKAGQILQYFVNSEVTNEWQGSRMMWGNYTVLSDSPTGLTGTRVSNGNGFNFDYWDHHAAWSDGAYYQFPRDYDEVWLNVVGYTVNLDGRIYIPGLKVDRCGALTGIVMDEVP